MKKYSLIRRAMAGFTTAAVLSTLLVSTQVNAGPTTPPYNFAEALQKSLYFYDAEKCGPGVSGGKLEWRGDCHLEDSHVPLVPRVKDGAGTNLSQAFIDKYKSILDPDGDGTVDLHGGFHDAGDHVKFGLPQGYAVSTLGWGFYEFRDSYKDIGEEDHMLDILKWGNDYFLRSTFMDKNGEVVAFSYQVGDGTIDHSWWQPPELNVKENVPRPAYFATSETPASDQCAEASASLSINYLNFKDKDPIYAKKCLDTAKALYKFAAKNRGLGDSGGFYGSAYDDDELAWAAVWLNIITSDKSYLDDIVTISPDGKYNGYMSRIIKSSQDGWQNIWVHSWDTVWGGVFAKLAPITNSDRDWYIFRWNLEYWSGIPHANPADTTFMEGTPAGFKVVNTWGSARYNTAAQLCALVYTKYTKKQDVSDWAKGQMNYILGDNPMKRCYEVGYSDISAKHPHHRAAHGSKTLSMNDPEEHRHTLWGALVGGPDSKDIHNDDTTDFVSNEVAVDYNAAFVGALAGLYKYYGQGQKPVPNFPPKENPEHEYYTEAKLEQENDERTQVTINIHNESSRPPHFIDNMKARYFFDISEMLKAGQTIDDLGVAVMYDEAKASDGKPAKIKGPFAWDEKKGIYYVEIDWAGDAIYGDREFHFGLVPKQDPNTWKSHWDPTNDFSREGIVKKYTITENIPLYIGDEKVFGNEPSGGTVTKSGDVDASGEVNMVDVLMLKKYILKKLDKLPDATAADMNGDGKVNTIDYLLLKQKVSQIS